MTGLKNEESKMGRREDVKERFKKWKDKDPYPEILPALLNSADIHDYIETTGMVDPYDPDLMKSSSYEAKIGNFAYRWGEGNERDTIPLGKDQFVKLEPNSLVFFETKETFRLPSYMAIRFNLRITNVHRGLLLGTGPLVDPGFEGKLLIPIHNLTNNTYEFCGGEKFIWIEFTKISRNTIWHHESQDEIYRDGDYKRFPDDKIDRKPPEYFEKANNGNSIQNAIPIALATSQKRAKDAEKQAEIAAKSAKGAEGSAKKLAKLVTGGGILAVIAAILSVIFGISPLITNSTNLSTDISKTISEFRKEYQDHLANEASSETKIEAFDGKIADIKLGDQMRDNISNQQRQLDALQEQIGAIQNELSRYKALQTQQDSE